MRSQSRSNKAAQTPLKMCAPPMHLFLVSIARTVRLCRCLADGDASANLGFSFRTRLVHPRLMILPPIVQALSVVLTIKAIGSHEANKVRDTYSMTQPDHNSKLAQCREGAHIKGMMCKTLWHHTPMLTHLSHTMFRSQYFNRLMKT